jgi:predicted MPP superfamily phosphohydrolase
MDISRRTVLKSILAAGVGGVTGAAAYGYLYEQRALTRTRPSIAVPRWPAALSGLRIGFMTDIHRSQWVSDLDLRHAVDSLITEQPDLIVLGGDYVTFADRRYITAAADALSRLSAPHGVFAVLGNHDDDREVPAALTRRGIEVLRDARTERRVRGERLDLVGIRYWTRRGSEIAAAARGAGPHSILLAHDPRRLTEAAALNIPLVLSGHTHGGQVVLPVLGAVAARKFPVVAGSATLGDTRIFVSRGVGTVYVPVRLACPPEIVVLTLHSA